MAHRIPRDQITGTGDLAKLVENEILQTDLEAQNDLGHWNQDQNLHGNPINVAALPQQVPIQRSTSTPIRNRNIEASSPQQEPIPKNASAQDDRRPGGHPMFGSVRPQVRENNHQYIRGISLLTGTDWSNREALQNILFQQASPDRFMASQGSPYMNNLMDIVQSTDDGMKQKNIRLSRRLPTWAWYLLAKSLGIPLHENEKPILATFLHVITMIIAFLYAVCGAWYNVADILSEYSKTTVLIGTVAIMLGIAWITMGIYAHKLARRLFSNKNFVESVRMHSKTFMKVSTVGLLILLSYSIIGIYSYDAYDRFVLNSTACSNANTFPEICLVMYGAMLTYSLVCVTWNILVGCVLLSVCRTHTVSLRRFMRELSLDGKVYEMNLSNESQEFQDPHAPDIANLEKLCQYDDDWFAWDDQLNQDHKSNEVTSQHIFLESIQGSEPSNTYTPSRRASDTSMFSRRNTDISQPDLSRRGSTGIMRTPRTLRPNSFSRQNSTLDDIVEGFQEANLKEENKDNDSSPESDHMPITEETQTEGAFDPPKDEQPPYEESEASDDDPEKSPSAPFHSPQIMPNANLLFSYWKLSQRLTVTSRYLQRWLSSWIAFIVIWCGDYIVYWTTHGATLPGILQFILPLFLLLIITSAYAEVNSEGQRLLRCICPTEERISILFFMYQQPIQMQVFSFAVSYNALLGVILAFSVAFSSRIILDEALK
ncbi:hypothetical protein LOTGIDRAFT_237862 [Lottia gigantea]|uniref:Uncharacterized protein n=1 Tax=Lottia gigantea TaxID=225164 RepID=V4CK59_LOTGI|nr:hypothetical protein LOTGIDRAFT_237862 [Lottia gigantea]ESP02615.1 hypothetical protein LOTGIDRAFT_237862 [Lottia gigantea]